MIFALLLLGVIGTGFYLSANQPGYLERATYFKNKYLPVEADIFDHLVRYVPFGFVQGNTIGRTEFKNPIPYVVRNEFSQVLLETENGYAVSSLNHPAVNTKGYQRLIDTQFNMEEHPRLDLTRQAMSYGRKPRTQYRFLDRTA